MRITIISVLKSFGHDRMESKEINTSSHHYVINNYLSLKLNQNLFIHNL